ncbi:LysR substrate-binding domain-containing protein [Luteimonas sp BLCC-B24]|uniref:LysR substrate-binding domain-containing protein n=1 Tax=Luteimonas sp. BLCC-B24 TaxID=3025317 RepID=UPI00234E2FF3|nr:LysR substrate-binding domain-containing protein [Luteimonas sp. BLCC-B24]MDC7807062.1 LysR substrate-binding domain-containing protein [Luteimonas sp. BLCC-B24]
MGTRAEWLSALAAFEAAARHQNFAHAGEELHLTASAVSHHVRKLEARLGLPLFQRHARGVSLTAAGRQLADVASSSLADLEDVLRRLRTHQDHDVVRVATLHSFASAWLIPRLSAFSDAHPGIRLSVETGFALARFDDNGPDLAIRLGPGHWSGAQATLLMHEQLFAVASPALPGVRAVTTARDVAALPLIADNGHQGWPDWFRAAGIVDLGPDARLRFTDAMGALEAAAHGLGAALARQCIVTPLLASGRLFRLPGPCVDGRWSYHLVLPGHRRLRPAARAFAEWVIDTARGTHRTPSPAPGPDVASATAPPVGAAASDPATA